MEKYDVIHNIYDFTATMFMNYQSQLHLKPIFCPSYSLDKSLNYFDIEKLYKVTNSSKFLGTSINNFCIIEEKHLNYI